MVACPITWIDRTWLSQISRSSRIAKAPISPNHRANLIGSRRGSAFRNLEKARTLSGGDRKIDGAVSNLDPRRPPVISWLPRDNFLNILLGRWRAALSRKS